MRRLLGRELRRAGAARARAVEARLRREAPRLPRRAAAGREGVADVAAALEELALEVEGAGLARARHQEGGELGDRRRVVGAAEVHRRHGRLDHRAGIVLLHRRQLEHRLGGVGLLHGHTERTCE